MILISHVMAIYAELDHQVAQFQLKTGLRCPPGCGRCCTTAHAHTTVLEMLPAAREILRRGAEEYWLSEINPADSGAECVLYQTKMAENSPGHCRLYDWRPSVCRLFGFSSARARNGERVLGACKHLKKSQPEAVARAAAHVADAPGLTDIGPRFYGIDPHDGSRLMPINEALRLAISRMGLHLQMTCGEKPGSFSVASFDFVR